MGFSVPSHLAYVFKGSRPVFLDIRNDRYFTVTPRLAGALSAVLKGSETSAVQPDVEALLAKGLIEVSPEAPVDRRSGVPATSENGVTDLGPRAFLAYGSVLASVVRARLRLKSRPFAQLVEDLGQRPRNGNTSAEKVMALAALFARLRPFVPVRRVCLLDSLALLDFLGRRHAQADLVFGVVPSPFSAHCWLQRDGCVLNDSLDHVRSHSTIMVL